MSITRRSGVWFTVVFFVFVQKHASIGDCMCQDLLLKYFYKLDSYFWIVTISGCCTAWLRDPLDTWDIKAYFWNILITAVGNNLIKVQPQWKSTRGGSSRIEGYGGGWGRLREIAKYIYFLSHRCWNFPHKWFFPLWIYKIKFTHQNGMTIIILRCAAACIEDWFFRLEVLTSSFPSPASVCFSGLWSSQDFCLSGPGCSLVLELCVCSCLGPCLAFWIYCFVLVPWFWPLALVLQFWPPGSSGPGFMLYCCLPGRWLHCIM